ncbi:hypothetical protein P4M26_24410 [Pseudomonas aeruginosa]|nr:hypothetical protein [Pseudomonas aeruginosa]MDF5995607.1 hypothetical protein [Pseudomonas aeruginosa]
MNRTEFTHAQAEISFLDRIAQKPGLSDLARLSLESRKIRLALAYEILTAALLLQQKPSSPTAERRSTASTELLLNSDRLPPQNFLMR